MRAMENRLSRRRDRIEGERAGILPIGSKPRRPRP